MNQQASTSDDARSVIRCNSPGSPVLVVVGAGLREYRSYALASMAARAPLVLLDPDPPAWTRAHTAAQLRVSIGDPVHLAAAIAEVADRYEVAGVATYAEDAVYAAAHVAEALHLPGPTPRAVAICRDKHATRRALEEAGVGSALSVPVRTRQQAAAAAERIGYPVVVKPRRLAGSVAVRLCETSQQVGDAFHAAAGAHLMGMDAGGGVLVEEYLDGPEISAECAITPDGTCHLVAITRKRLGPHPSFEEIGHLVDAQDPLLADEALAETVFAAAAACGYRAGVIHIELRLLKNRHAVVEINARPGGDLIGHLVHLALGVDLAGVSADLALGREPDLVPTTRGAAGIRFLYPDRAGVLEHHVGLHPAADWLERFTWTCRAGDHVAPPPQGTLTDRLGHMVVTGPDFATCENRLNAVAEDTRIRIRPRTTPHACIH